MSQLRLFVLGYPQLEQDGVPVDINLRKAWALLIYLAMTGEAHSRDLLATLFWPENDQSSARANLRRVLYILNQALGDHVILATPEALSINPNEELWIDAVTFQEHYEECLKVDPEDVMPLGCLSHLADATDLYTDDFLEGFNLPACPDFDEWQYFEGEELRRREAQMLVHLAKGHQAIDELERAIVYARRWLALDVLHEPAHRMLMQLYASAGQQAAALRQYKECERLLDEELALRPGPETVELYQAIRQRKALPSPDVHSAPYPDIHYVQSGKVHIAYQVLGDGPIDLVHVPGFISHLELLWEEPRLARFNQRLAEMARLILFDKRGVGLSDRVGYPPTLEHTMDDILAVMDAVDSKQAILFGVSEGGPISAMFAATYPQRVRALILYGTMAKGVRSNDYPLVLSREQYDKWLEAIVTDWGGPSAIEVFAPSQINRPGFRQWWAKMVRTSSSPGGVKGIMEVLRDIDVRHVLPAIHVPTLVLHRINDRAVWKAAGRHLAEQIPNAQYVELPGEDHFWWVGEWEAILREMDTFLAELSQPTETNNILATILVAETSDNMARVLSAIEPEISRYKGRVARQSDTQLMAVFEGPSRAIYCARAIQQNATEQDIKLGVHSGECEISENGLRGATAQIAEGIADQAIPGQIIVSRTVKDLVVGSGINFARCGSYPFSESEEEWPLFSMESIEKEALAN